MIRLDEFEADHTTYPDGIHSNFIFRGNDVARPAWRFLDLTKHVIYLAHALERTIRVEMREESLYLRSHAQAKAAIKNIIEMTDMQVDRIIRSVESNQGKLSNVLIKEIPMLEQPGAWEEIVLAIKIAFRVDSEVRE
jgi:hypothetical protein